MPTPPRSNESRSSWVSRAIRFFRNTERLNQKEAVGKAEGMADKWFTKDGKRKTR